MITIFHEAHYDKLAPEKMKKRQKENIKNMVFQLDHVNETTLIFCDGKEGGKEKIQLSLNRVSPF